MRNLKDYFLFENFSLPLALPELALREANMAVRDFVRK